MGGGVVIRPYTLFMLSSFDGVYGLAWLKKNIYRAMKIRFLLKTTSLKQWTPQCKYVFIRNFYHDIEYSEHRS